MVMSFLSTSEKLSSPKNWPCISPVWYSDPRNLFISQFPHTCRTGVILSITKIHLKEESNFYETLECMESSWGSAYGEIPGFLSAACGRYAVSKVTGYVLNLNAKPLKDIKNNDLFSSMRQEFAVACSHNAAGLYHNDYIEKNPRFPDFSVLFFF